MNNPSADIIIQTIYPDFVNSNCDIAQAKKTHGKEITNIITNHYLKNNNAVFEWPLENKEVAKNLIYKLANAGYISIPQLAAMDAETIIKITQFPVVTDFLKNAIRQKKKIKLDYLNQLNFDNLTLFPLLSSNIISQAEISKYPFNSLEFDLFHTFVLNTDWNQLRDISLLRQLNIFFNSQYYQNLVDTLFLPIQLLIETSPSAGVSFLLTVKDSLHNIIKNHFSQIRVNNSMQITYSIPAIEDTLELLQKNLAAAIREITVNKDTQKLRHSYTFFNTPDNNPLLKICDDFLQKNKTYEAKNFSTSSFAI